jgi:class 3 adenylate cyclase
MSPESFKRKLTAVLSADVKGYSRLMGENEAETVKTLSAYRKIMGELNQQHRGRVIGSPGDRLLAEFALDTQWYNPPYSVPQKKSSCHHSTRTTFCLRNS